MFNIKKISIVTFIIITMASLTGCQQENYVSTKSGIELQAIQKQEFETSYATAFASVLSVFQDKGYIIETADKDTGFITAASNKTQGFVMFAGVTVNYLKATAFIESMPSSKVGIRLNFVNNQETSDGYVMSGGNSVPVEDPEFYQGAFQKIQKAIFVRESTN